MLTNRFEIDESPLQSRITVSLELRCAVPQRTIHRGIEVSRAMRENSHLTGAIVCLATCTSTSHDLRAHRDSNSNPAKALYNQYWMHYVQPEARLIMLKSRALSIVPIGTAP